MAGIELIELEENFTPQISERDKVIWGGCLTWVHSLEHQQCAAKCVTLLESAECYVPLYKGCL